MTQYCDTLSIMDEGDKIKSHQLHAALKVKSNYFFYCGSNNFRILPELHKACFQAGQCLKK